MTLPAQTVSYKLKVRPEDFRVVERADLALADRGPFRVYRLTKTNWNTVDLLLRLARRLGLKFEDLAYGGRKDRHAITAQHITIRDERDFSLAEEGFSLESLGFAGEPMTPDRIQANEFTLTLRALKPDDLPRIETNAAAAIAGGLPNYFDDQRFRSYDKRRGFVAERLLRGAWEEALEMLLTSTRPDEKKASRERKRSFVTNWGNWGACLERAGSVAEKRVFRHLLARPDDSRGALGFAPRDELSIMLSAYQSFLWNEMVCEAVRDLAEEEDLREVKGAVRPYVFYLRMKGEAAERLKALEIPVPGPGARLPDPYGASVYARVIDREGAKDCSFELPHFRAARLKSYPRRTLLFPEGLEFLDSGLDDLYPGRSRITVRFALPRGAYATVVVKRLVMA